MSDFPLCKKAGLEIKETYFTEKSDNLIGTKFINDKVVKAKDVEALLEEASVYYCDAKAIAPTQIKNHLSTHTARLILIEPIKQKSREEKALDLLREIVKAHNPETGAYYWIDGIYERAKALLGEKE